jgi:hypothetical protein
MLPASVRLTAFHTFGEAAEINAVSQTSGDTSEYSTVRVGASVSHDRSGTA